MEGPQGVVHQYASFNEEHGMLKPGSIRLLVSGNWKQILNMDLSNYKLIKLLADQNTYNLSTWSSLTFSLSNTFKSANIVEKVTQLCLKASTVNSDNS
jgi:hypothetical protein